MICVYHNDMDGKLSAAIVQRKFHRENITFQPMSYDDILPEFPEGEVMYLVDYSFDYETMVKLNERYELHWIDHHKNIIEQLTEKGFLASGGQYIKTDAAACKGVWKYLFGDAQIPLCVKYVNAYDIGQYGDPNVALFDYGLQLHDTQPTSNLWKQLLARTFVTYENMYQICSIIENGKLLKNFLEKQDAAVVRRAGHEVIFYGYQTLFVNYYRMTSQILDNLPSGHGHDIIVIYEHRRGRVKYSIRALKDDVDVSEIARAYEGNGHKAAAGFWTDKLFDWDNMP